jgi:hypothetical protein
LDPSSGEIPKTIGEGVLLQLAIVLSNAQYVFWGQTIHQTVVHLENLYSSLLSANPYFGIKN